ncbi:MAG TPA: choice-of-anchor Q domain-containing protein [Anaerolineales bacterium]|nr:choice-of-anchor Q domain-containing protein [Anaerolineales bacterium]
MQHSSIGIFSRLVLSLALVSMLVLGTAGHASAATVIYVRATAKGKNNGTSWANAYTSLQTALGKAKSGQQIWVAKGTYKPGTAVGSSFRLKNGVSIYGGFAGNEKILTQRKPTVNVTTLSGDIGVAGKVTDNIYHIVLGGGTNQTAVLDGFTIRAGNPHGILPNQQIGGGMYNVNSSPTLRNLVFLYNRASVSGAGMYNDHSNPSLTGVTFTWNTAGTTAGGGMYNLSSNPILNNVTFASNNGGTTGGGGIYNDNSSPRLTNVRFTNNTAGAEGGGMFNNNTSGPSNPILNSVTFTGNSANQGGGMSNEGSRPSLTNVTFSANKAKGSGQGGGGMFNSNGSNPSLHSVTFAGNTTAGKGGAMYNNNVSNPSLVNVTFSGNTATGTDPGTGLGGAMYNDASSPVLNNVTFSGNSVATPGNGDAMYNKGSAAQISNTVLWGDGTVEIVDDTVAVSTLTIQDSVIQGAVASVSDCLADGQATCTHVLTTTPALGILASNGGSTQTRWLGAGSSALDTGGVNVPCAIKDQRGVARPQGGTCDMGAYEVKVVTYVSQSAYDGQVLESGENSSVGGTANSSSGTIQMGDDNLNRQFRGFLSFDTSSLADNASVITARIQIRWMSGQGDPFGTLGALRVDLRKPYFGTSLVLLSSDFQAPPGVSSAGTISSSLVAGWYSGLLSSTGRTGINKTGPTQFRLSFTNDDNNDLAFDSIAVASGNNGTLSNRPKLTIYYNP